ncbi:MAG: DUF4829 domain-containing protein [Syntrophomonadaceae bacterium]|nr:DUF4829 domain-containing protein [Syntrophomonadaceae bacterium]
MFKKILHMMIIIGIVAGFAGCSQVSNDENTITNQTAQKEANEITDSAVPDFEKIYNNTVEIEVNFDPNGMYRDFQTIKIKDGKMLSAILTMIGKSQIITDESKTNNMSGMATRENRLILAARDGSKKEIKFAFDDPAFAVGYLAIDEAKYDPGFSFFRYIKDFTEYQQFDTNINYAVMDLFGKYNWTVDYKVNSGNETLPSDLKHEAGEFPVEIYWAYNNELSKNIGLDYTGYLGKEVQVDIYRLREPLPDYMHPRMNARGIVLKHGDEIIGAYIDAGRHNSFACSLDRKSLQDITGKEWDEWVTDHINYNNELETKLSKMKPEEVIRQYYDAMNSHDQKMQFACMTRQNLCNYLSSNMDNNRLINQGFNDVFIDGEQNVKSAKLLDVQEMSGIDNGSGTVEYAVTVDYQFKKEITSASGEQPRFIILKKESDQSGWRIQSEGTGP